MAQDPAYQPQPEPKDPKRGTPAEQGAPSYNAPDELRDHDFTADDPPEKKSDDPVKKP